jgi:hypothetical protein
MSSSFPQFNRTELGIRLRESLSVNFPEEKSLMRWTEPTALYEQKRQSVFYFIWPFIPFGICLAVFLLHLHEMNNTVMYCLSSAALFLGVLIVAGRKLPGTLDELKEDRIWQAVGGPGRRGSAFSSNYKDIESCQVTCDNYKCARFSVLKIRMKVERQPFKVRVISPVKAIIVPEEVNLDSVLQILRDKGVHVVKG